MEEQEEQQKEELEEEARSSSRIRGNNGLRKHTRGIRLDIVCSDSLQLLMHRLPLSVVPWQ